MEVSLLWILLMFLDTIEGSFAICFLLPTGYFYFIRAGKKKQVPCLQIRHYLIDGINYIVYTSDGKVDFKGRYPT